MDDSVKDFLLRSRNQLNDAQHCLLRLRREPGPVVGHVGSFSPEPHLAEVIATFHNIKGTSGFLGFNRLIALSRAGERLALAVEEGAVPCSSEIVDGLSAVTGEIELIVALLLATGAESSPEGRKKDEGDDAALIAMLERLRNDGEGSSGGSGKRVLTRGGLRIERVPRSAIEYLGVTPLLHFEGSVLPVSDAAAILEAVDGLGVGAELVVVVEQNGAQRAAVVLVEDAVELM